MSHEPGVGEAGADQVVGGGRAVEVTAFSVALHGGVLEGEDGVGEVALGDLLDGGEDADGAGPDVVALSGAGGLEGGGDGEPAELDPAPGGLVVDGAVVVEVVHGEVHEGVLVAEDHLIHHQTVELLVGGTLEAGDGEGVEDFGVGAQVEAAQGHRVGVLGHGGIGHSQADHARGDAVDLRLGAGGVLGCDQPAEQQAYQQACSCFHSETIMRYHLRL